MEALGKVVHPLLPGRPGPPPGQRVPRLVAPPGHVRPAQPVADVGAGAAAAAEQRVPVVAALGTGRAVAAAAAAAAAARLAGLGEVSWADREDQATSQRGDVAPVLHACAVVAAGVGEERELGVPLQAVVDADGGVVGGSAGDGVGREHFTAPGQPQVGGLLVHARDVVEGVVSGLVAGNEGEKLKGRC